MKTIDFEVGQRVVVNARADKLKGTYGIVVGHKTNRLAMLYGRMQLVETYLVRMETGTTNPVMPMVLEVAPPITRGDLDKKVAWSALPEDVERACKGADYA